MSQKLNSFVTAVDTSPNPTGPEEFAELKMFPILETILRILFKGLTKRWDIVENANARRNAANVRNIPVQVAMIRGISETKSFELLNAKEVVFLQPLKLLRPPNLLGVCIRKLVIQLWDEGLWDVVLWGQEWGLVVDVT